MALKAIGLDKSRVTEAQHIGTMPCNKLTKAISIWCGEPHGPSCLSRTRVNRCARPQPLSGRYCAA